MRESIPPTLTGPSTLARPTGAAAVSKTVNAVNQIALKVGMQIEIQLARQLSSHLIEARLRPLEGNVPWSTATPVQLAAPLSASLAQRLAAFSETGTASNKLRTAADVVAISPTLILRIRPQTELATASRMLPPAAGSRAWLDAQLCQHLPESMPLTSTINRWISQINRPDVPAGLAMPPAGNTVHATDSTQRMIATLVGRLATTKELVDPEHLSSALQQSGIWLEALMGQALLNATPPCDLTLDLKAQLLRLAEQIRASAGQISTPVGRSAQSHAHVPESTPPNALATEPAKSANGVSLERASTSANPAPRPAADPPDSQTPTPTGRPAQPQTPAQESASPNALTTEPAKSDNGGNPELTPASPSRAANSERLPGTDPPDSQTPTPTGRPAQPQTPAQESTTPNALTTEPAKSANGGNLELPPASPSRAANPERLPGTDPPDSQTPTPTGRPTQSQTPGQESAPPNALTTEPTKSANGSNLELTPASPSRAANPERLPGTDPPDSQTPTPTGRPTQSQTPGQESTPPNALATEPAKSANGVSLERASTSTNPAPRPAADPPDSQTPTPTGRPAQPQTPAQESASPNALTTEPAKSDNGGNLERSTHPSWFTTSEPLPAPDRQAQTQSPQTAAPSTLTKDVDGMIKQIVTHQLHSLDTGAEQPQWRLELPFMTPAGLMALEADIRRKKHTEGQPDDESWSMRIRLDLPRLGPLLINLNIKSERLNAGLQAGTETGADILRTHLATLRQQLEARNIEIASLHAGYRPNHKPEPTQRSPLVSELA